MTVASLVSVAAVREYLSLNATDNTSRYTDQTIGSNIRAASAFLERATGRIFRDETALTMLFTTEGRASIGIPGLRVPTAVSLNGTTLTENSTYWLIPDEQQTGVYVRMQFRAFNTAPRGGPWFLGVPDWWDRGLDLPGGADARGSLPNDLSIAGSWGYTDANLPEAVRQAAKVLAAWYTLRPSALLAGGYATPEGASFDLSAIPPEVQQFINEWSVLSGVTAVG